MHPDIPFSDNRPPLRIASPSITQPTRKCSGPTAHKSRHPAPIRDRRIPRAFIQFSLGTENSTHNIHSLQPSSSCFFRFPPRNQDPSVSSYPSNHHATARRVPSIQMLPEEESASLYNEASFKHYPRSLPIVRRVDTVGASDPVSGMARRRGEFAVGACRSANPSVPSSPAKYRHHVRGDRKSVV